MLKKPGGGGGGGAPAQLVTPMNAMPGASFSPGLPGAAASEAAQRSGRFVVTFD